MLRGPLQESILKKAQERGLLTVRLHDLREFASGPHRQVDDSPYGGGNGMVLMPGPIFDAVEAVVTGYPAPRSRTILLSPQGRRFDQSSARELVARFDRLILICGRYEGVDERVREFLVDEEISIGDYVLTGGEPAALVIIDALARLIPGVLGSTQSAEEDSFTEGILEYPHYTRPARFRGHDVPEILLSGNHGEIERWRRGKAVENTLKKRPDLLKDVVKVGED